MVACDRSNQKRSITKRITRTTRQKSQKTPDTIEDDIYGDGDFTRSVFFLAFLMYVNRVPTSGTVKKVVYRTGQFLNAGSERASIENERSSVLLELEDQRTLGFVQIAGLVARRIINELKKAMTLSGETDSA